MKSLDELAQAALAARARAYAPYSRYAVGAALATRDGRVFIGANVENATYGLSVCAERAAVIAAVTAGVRDFEGLAVATQSSPPAAPCGPCLQTLAEFARALPIVMVNDRGERRQQDLRELLPHAFRPEDLQPGPHAGAPPRPRPKDDK